MPMGYLGRIIRYVFIDTINVFLCIAWRFGMSIGTIEEVELTLMFLMFVSG